MNCRRKKSRLIPLQKDMGFFDISFASSGVDRASGLPTVLEEGGTVAATAKAAATAAVGVVVMVVITPAPRHAACSSCLLQPTYPPYL